MDEKFMLRAVELAKKGEGKVNPNPLVGAVIVKNGQIIGEGYHTKYGELHAEREAFKNCIEDAEGATMYVTLEPCCHYGKTPPCVDAIIENKISKVIVGTLDPNPKVSGKGIDILRKNGIEVIDGVLEKECAELNSVFFHYINTRTPYVVLKYAMTIDGKIATKTGESKWITGEAARKNVHKDRNKYMGIMVGVNTVIKDNPRLDCRIDDGRNPVKIICDTKLRTPLDSKIVELSNIDRTIIVTKSTDIELIYKYKEKGVEIIIQDGTDDKIDLNSLMNKLGEMGIDGILLEGGSTLAWSALKDGIVKRVQTYISTKIFGGIAKSPVGGSGVSFPSEAIKLKNQTIKYFGEDILIESEVANCLQE